MDEYIAAYEDIRNKVPAAELATRMTPYIHIETLSAKAFPARRNPDTVYPAPGERNRPRGSSNKEFDVSTWVEETTVVIPIKQLCEKSESLRRELLNALTPRAEPRAERRVESQFDDIPRPPQRRQPIVEFDEGVEEPVLRRSRRRGTERERDREAGRERGRESEDDEDELEDTITVQPRINREPRAMISNDSDSEDYSLAFMVAAFF